MAHLLRTLAALALAAPLVAQGERAQAPDGRRGLGAETKLTDVLSVVRASKDDDRAFVAELAGLPTEIRLLVAGTTERCRSRGYFALLDAGAATDVQSLWSEFARFAADPFPVLLQGGPRAKAFAQIVFDTRLRARAAAAAGFELETRELSRGLDVLRGANAGYVQLTQAEVGNITSRIDLAASLLRASRDDLVALAPTDADRADDAVRDERAAKLLALATASEGENVRRAGVARECEQAARSVESMTRMLFSTRLREKLAALLEWRERIFTGAAPLRAEALQYLPDTEEGRAAPNSIQTLAKHERMRGAGYAATRGLALDPLDEELAWIAGHCADFLYGVVESRPLYDRYLALRGIRSFDHRTFFGRSLNARESEALDVIQRSELPQPGKPRSL